MRETELFVNFEQIRVAARSVLGYRSPVYGLGSRVLTQYEIIRRESWKTLRQLNRITDASEGSEMLLSLRSLRYPIVVRAGTDDLLTVVNNVIREEYGHFAKTFAPRVIVDAGAYIGDTSAYFLSRYPNSHVIALEPNEESHPLAAQNLRPYGNRVVLLKKALWNELTAVSFAGMQTAAAINARGSEVPTETIESLMAKFDLDFIDLLKLDIEGAESKVVPAGVDSWLDKVGTICLETHGSLIEQRLIPLLTSVGFDCARFRNVWYCASCRGTR